MGKAQHAVDRGHRRPRDRLGIVRGHEVTHGFEQAFELLDGSMRFEGATDPRTEQRRRVRGRDHLRRPGVQRLDRGPLPVGHHHDRDRAEPIPDGPERREGTPQPGPDFVLGRTGDDAVDRALAGTRERVL